MAQVPCEQPRVSQHIRSEKKPIGKNTSVSSDGNAKPEGRTPTTVNTSESMVIVLPSASLPPPSQRFQKPSVTTATGSAPAQVSSEEKALPSAGCTPRVSNQSPSTQRVMITSGRSPPVKVADRRALAVKVSIVRLRSRQSLKLGIDSEIS